MAGLTRRGALAAPAAIALAASGAPPSRAEEISARLDWWLAEEIKFNAEPWHSDEESDALCARQKVDREAAEALEGDDLETLRAKAKAVLLCYGGALDDIVGDPRYACNRLTRQILATLLEAI